jgi:O-antigen/teichoic acid export membrane protein
MTANVAASGPTDESAPARPGLSTVILRNTVWATIGLGLVKLTSFLFLIVTARILGESGLGKYFTVVAFVDLFSVLFELGMTQYVQREVARDRSRAAGLFWNLVALRFLLAVASCGLIVGLATLAGYEPRWSSCMLPSPPPCSIGAASP